MEDNLMSLTQEIFGVIGWLGLTFGAAWLGSRFLPDQWYQNLSKPTWNPPNSIFAPVWTILYLLMALAAWWIWRSNGLQTTLFPLTMFGLQLLLNVAWSWLFFGRHRPDLAFLDIIGLWIALLITLLSFWRLTALAGILLIPYLAWVSFAAILNWTIWQMNRYLDSSSKS
jgi:benzodiazapine receptor